MALADSPGSQKRWTRWTRTASRHCEGVWRVKLGRWSDERVFSQDVQSGKKRTMGVQAVNQEELGLNQTKIKISQSNFMVGSSIKNWVSITKSNGFVCLATTIYPSWSFSKATMTELSPNCKGQTAARYKGKPTHEWYSSILLGW